MSDLARQLEAARDFGAGELAVIGDLILDEYVEGPVRRVSPEAPVQVVSVDRTFYRLGGAANVAHIAACLGARTSIAGCAGKDPAGATLRSLLHEASIDTTHVIDLDDRPTTRKLRVLAQRQQLIRLDWERIAPVDATVAAACERVCASVGKRGAIVVSDYGKGVVGAEVMERIVAASRKSGVPLLVDPKSRDLRMYRGATIIKPNLRELEEATGRSLSHVTDEELADVVRAMVVACEVEAIVVTLGPRGMLLVPKSGAPTQIAASAREVFDVTGAGDAAIASLALGIGAGLTLSDASAIANAAAGVVVGKVGTAVVQPGELLRALAPHGHDKVLSRADLRGALATWRASKRRIVFTNGCFDLLHAGHLATLRAAASHGDALIVAINSDASVRRLKGPTRPLVGEGERAALVAALECVSATVVFDEDTPLALIEQILPDVLVKGADYSVDQVVGREVVEANGGRVELVKIQPGRSTTSLVERIRREGQA